MHTITSVYNRTRLRFLDADPLKNRSVLRCSCIPESSVFGCARPHGQQPKGRLKFNELNSPRLVWSSSGDITRLLGREGEGVWGGGCVSSPSEFSVSVRESARSNA